ncbi:Gfo/Idh/MocA family oxidoreductase [Dickeya chrysanthemi]|uniref:Gfo/Idh/MocA family oxidoreductase n=1 Tax=Dickeya chrysanthemi TaxID=556 RepID=UPI001CF14147|nr:Gfo/Idh/MocA family oxidoreductase [Dickeya chrysanthemi]MCA7008924.1 Gfo/Idh/MocA family oxidoreductase [Dickeya chrysanthemi]
MMNILIVGLGYAGNRFYSAFKNVIHTEKINFAYVNRTKISHELPCYESVQVALEKFKPEIIVISATDNQHINIIESLSSYDGFILCEKPLTTPGDGWKTACNNLQNLSGFALDLVERYSFATILLKSLIIERKWKLVRANFVWGKNRINDYRPTCGVTSEVIHPLDLITWICNEKCSLDIRSVSGVKSDFSISGDHILDTVLLTAELSNVPVTGFSSFVNIQRQRSVDFSFTDEIGEIIHARIIYDTPSWDCDHLRIWSLNSDGSENIIINERQENSVEKFSTIYKLSKLCSDVYGYVKDGTPPSQSFPGLETAVRLQETLDYIQEHAVTPEPASYTHRGERKLLTKESALEVLG